MHQNARSATIPAPNKKSMDTLSNLITQQSLQQLSQLEQFKDNKFKEAQRIIDEITDKLHRTTTIGGKNQKVKLRVGEKKFITSWDTLTTEKDTYFSGLLSDTEVNEDGEIFIDRDPTHFRLILNHFRGIDVSGNIEALSTNQKKELQQEVDFYQITSMFHWFPTHFKDKLQLMGISVTSTCIDSQMYVSRTSKDRTGTYQYWYNREQ
jgi:hypothetical protein